MMPLHLAIEKIPECGNVALAGLGHGSREHNFSLLQQAGRTPPCVPETFLPSSFSPQHCKDKKSHEEQTEYGRVIFGT